MKNIIYLILGIILGIITLRLAIAGLVCLRNCVFLSGVICILLTYWSGLLTGKCFKRI